jgi:catechol 2,3-dioxygenase-like lactoylglutathione lyase family enzyme
MESLSQEPPPQGSPVPLAAPALRVLGLHHATLISSDLEQTTAFYRDLLGFTLVRETVNEDDPGTRHFWFAADPADPSGLRLSFLEYPQMEPGSQGTGAVHHLALRVGSAAEVGAWRDYLQSRGIPTTPVHERGELTSVYLRDPDGHILEIVAEAA